MPALDSPNGAALADVWPPHLPPALRAAVTADVEKSHGYSHVDGASPDGPVVLTTAAAVVVWEDGLVIEYRPSAVRIDRRLRRRHVVAPRCSVLPVPEEAPASDAASPADAPPPAEGDERVDRPVAEPPVARQPPTVPPIVIPIDRSTAQRVQELADRPMPADVPEGASIARGVITTERPAPPTRAAAPERSRQSATTSPRAARVRRNAPVPVAGDWLRLVTTAIGPVQAGVCETVLDPVGYVRMLESGQLVVAATRGAGLAIGDAVDLVLSPQSDELARVVDTPPRTSA